MKRLAEIVAAYLRVDRIIEGQRGQSAATSLQIAVCQVLNDQAYFLLCWGQLETEIDERCRTVIRRRRSSSDWQIRRGWDLYNPDDRRLSGLSFDDRAGVVLDRAEGSGQPYAKTMAYYQSRNSIAHGRLATTRVDVIAVAQDFYTIQAALERNA